MSMYNKWQRKLQKVHLEKRKSGKMDIGDARKTKRKVGLKERRKG